MYLLYFNIYLLHYIQICNIAFPRTACYKKNLINTKVNTQVTSLDHILWMEPQRIKSIQKYVTDISDESPY